LKTFEIVVKTLFGLEEVLIAELKALGITEVEKLSRAVRFVGTQELLYKCNLHLRTALKVLKPIASFIANNENVLYKEVQKINWSDYFSFKQTFAIEATTKGEIFTHSKYVALKTKDAIADQFRAQKGIRPSVDTENPDLCIDVFINRNECIISLNSSGVHLGKRGYRATQILAPMSENLAAGLVLLSKWDTQSDFYDPLCGSGTIAIEAALIAKNMAPGINRTFNFEKWVDFDKVTWNNIKKQAVENQRKFEHTIYCHDIDANAVEISEKNAVLAQTDDIMDIEKQDFFDSQLQLSNATIIMNPPYGERLNKEEDMVALYKKIGDKLKQSFNNNNAWILSGNMEAIKFVGLKPSQKINLFNGPIECKYHKFELYKGKKN